MRDPVLLKNRVSRFDDDKNMTDSQTPIYQVTLPVFEGPLDLLLHLIERQELDITQVSLAQVTNQYLEHLAQISERDPDNLAGFLVVAARLLLIKSRVLLPLPPAPPAPEDAEADVGEDLIRQLIEYKRFKEAARWLQELDAQGKRSYVRLGTMPHFERVLDLGDVALDDLWAAVRQALTIKPPEPLVDGLVAPLAITIAEQIDFIERQVSRGSPVSFRRLLERTGSRLEVIVTLLALLEMVKQLRVRMRQDQLFGDILILGRETDPRP